MCVKVSCGTISISFQWDLDVQQHSQAGERGSQISFVCLVPAILCIECEEAINAGKESIDEFKLSHS